MLGQNSTQKKFLLFVTVICLAFILYAVDIVSAAIYANKSSAAIKAALAKEPEAPLLDPTILPLLEILRRDKGELALESAQSIIELGAGINSNSLKEFIDRVQGSKAKMTFGVSESTLLKWKALAESAHSANSEDLPEESKRQGITTLKLEVNKAIVAALVTQPPQSTVNQYILLKNYIPALPELDELISNRIQAPN